jgi:hypothetical protein
MACQSLGSPDVTCATCCIEFFLWFQSLHNVLGVDYQAHVRPLSGCAIERYSAGYVFPVPFSMPAFAF